MSYRQAVLPATAKPFLTIPPSDIITQFQSGHGFTTSGADSSSNLNDTSNFVIGTQAATLVTAGAGATTYLEHKGLSAVDMTSKQYVLVVECDNPAHIETGDFDFMAGTGASSSTTYQWQLYSAGNEPQNVIQAGRWSYYVLNFADATVNGSPVRTAITDYYIKVNDDNTGNKVTVRVNAIYAIPDSSGLAPYARSFPNGAATICFDDSFASQWTDGKPVLDAAGLTASVFTIWDRLGLSGRLAASQLLEMQDISGWDINSHSLTDADHTSTFTSLTTAELESNLTTIQQIMTAGGFQGKGIAYPLGNASAVIIATIRKYFQYARGTYNKTLETLPVADIFNLRAISSISPISGGYSPSSIYQSSGLIDETVSQHRWLILTFHKIIGNVTACNNTSGTTYQIIYSDTSPPYNTGDSVTLQGFSPSGLNGTYTVTSDGTTGGFGYIEVSIPANPGSATIQGTALSATTDCDLASFTSIVDKLVSAGVPVLNMADMMKCLYPEPVVPAISAADTSIVIGGTAAAPTVATGTLDVIAAQHPPAAAVAMNSEKITGVANGSASTDAAAFGQIPVLSTSAPLADATTPAAGSSTQAPKQDHQHPRTYWVPSDHGLLAWAYDPVTASSSTALGTAGSSAGELVTIRMHNPVAQSITNILLALTTLGSGLTAGECFAALYQSGTLLGVTGDQTAVWNTGSSTGLKTAAISGGPVAAAAGDLIVAAWYNGSTGPTFARGAGNSLINGGLSAANSRFGTANTGVTTTAPGTLGTISPLSVSYWAALS